MNQNLKILAVTSCPIFQHLLEDATAHLTQIECTCIKNSNDIPKKHNYSIILHDIRGEKHDLPIVKSEKALDIGVIDQELSNNADLSKYFDKIMASPLKIGVFLDELYYLHQKMVLSHKMKPLIMGDYTLELKNNYFIDNLTGEKTLLTDKEKDIILYLYQKSGGMTTREDLLNNVWNYAEGVETHTLETHIYRLRQKIEKNPAQPAFLMTDDEGYYLAF